MVLSAHFCQVLQPRSWYSSGFSSRVCLNRPYVVWFVIGPGRALSEPMTENVSGYSRNPCSLNRERDAAFAAKLLTLADRDLFVREIWGADGAFASVSWRRRAISQWIGMILYGFQTIGMPRGVPEAWKLTQRLVPYSENKGYASSLRRFNALFNYF